MADIITVVFDPPLLSDTPAVFDAKAQDSVGKFPAFIAQTNAARDAINADKTAAEAAQASAASSADAAEDSAQAALAAALASAADWQAATAYAKNDIRWGSAAGGQLYRCILAYAGSATPPADDPTHWAPVLIDPATVAALGARMTAAEAVADGLRDLPVKTKGAAHTLELSDRGCCIRTANAVTIPANAAVAFPDGAMVVIRNTSAAAIAINITTDTLRLAGTTKTGARTLGPYGEARLHKDAATVWFATGAGLA